MNNAGPQSLAHKIAIFIAKYRALIVLFLFIFVLRIPSLVEPHRYADEEIYLTLGQAVRKGLVLYRDIHDNKPPLLYLVAAVAGSLFWFRFILLVFHTFGVIFFWKLAELLFDKNRVAVFIATAVFGVFSTLPTLEGNIANGENFMIVPAIIGFFLFYRFLTVPSTNHRPLIPFSIGLSFAVSFLFKIPILFDFFSLLLFWCFFVEPSFRVRVLVRRMLSLPFLAMVSGFVLPVLLSIAYYSWLGAFEPYVSAALFQNVGYVSSWRSGGEVFFLNPLIWRGAVVLGVTVFLFLFSSKLSMAVRFVSLWAVFSMYGALLSSRPYPHYLLEPLAAAVFLITLVYSERFFLVRLLAAMLFTLLLLAYIENRFWYYPTFPYYRNFIRYATGRIGWDGYLDSFGVRRNYLISSYITQHTFASDRIFVWGTEPSIYALSERLPVGRYAVSYHIFDFRAFDETIIAIQESPPPYIIVIEDLDRFTQLKSYLVKYYILETTIEGASLYRRLPDTQAQVGH